MFVFVLISNAQSVANKISKTNNKINNTDTAINNTSDAINNSSGTLNNAGQAFNKFGNALGSLIKKKSKQGTAKTTGMTDSAILINQAIVNTINISINGADYISVKKLKENLKAVKGVQSVDMNYNSSGSSFSIATYKKADDLWDGLSDDVTVHYNILSINGNSICITYKK